MMLLFFLRIPQNILCCTQVRVFLIIFIENILSSFCQWIDIESETFCEKRKNGFRESIYILDVGRGIFSPKYSFASRL